MNKRRRCNRVLGGLSAAGMIWMGMFVAVVALNMGGCPNFGGGNGGNTNTNTNTNTNNNTGSDVAEIVSPTSNFGLSALDDPISVIYNVPEGAENIRGYFVEVAAPTPDSQPISERTIIISGLPAGDARTFNFDPGEANVGLFRVGILFELDGIEEIAESEAVIEVQGAPDPIFVQPAESFTEVEEGDVIDIAFDARDPEDEVQWRLFYLDENDDRDLPPDQIGTTIAVGTGNAGTSSFNTSGLEQGNYQLGVAATDSGASVAATVAQGEIDRIVVIPNDDVSTPVIRVISEVDPTAPTIAITAPGAEDVSLFRDEPFTIRFNGDLTREGAEGSIEVFYDTDTNVNNGFTTIAADLSVDATSVPFPSDVPEGTYFIGATIRDELSSATAYATGRIIVVRTVTLEVDRPNSSLPVPPGTEVVVAWTTNAPAGSGTVEVVAQAVDTSGAPFGTEIVILENADVSTKTATFRPSTPGLYQITVRITLGEGTVIQDTAPNNIRVSSLPGVLWLGSLAEAESSSVGAIFEGVNFEDNAGSDSRGVGDLDGDGLGELLISARYGKPFFLNPSGVGPGEAYLVYGGGGATRLQGVFSLNSVGTGLLRGITLTGIRTRNDTDITDGLATVAVIPDSDGDATNEIVFGFPRTDSAGATVGPLESAGQFLRGGVVILSSETAVLGDPAGLSPVINLNRVGQVFSDLSINATPAQTLADTQNFEEGDPDGNPPTPNACVEGTDGILDTIIGPFFGFIPALAPPRYTTLGFVPILSGTPTEGNCPTIFTVNVGACSNVFSGTNPGSGFYPTTGTAINPLGARIIGIDQGDEFGSSVTFSNALGGTARGDIIISAPKRDATPSEIEGLNSELSEAGVAYMTGNRALWRPDPVFTAGEPPPRPHQYMIGTNSHCGNGRAPALGALQIAGDADDQIRNILGIPDFNRDGRNDIMIGAPLANGGAGRVYIAYRREQRIEGDYVLSKLGLAPNDPERLNGLLVVTTTPDALGASIAGGFDFNGDNIPDIVVGSPNAGSGTGEVVVIFGGTNISSPASGLTVATLLTSRTPAGAPVAVRITGNTIDTEKGLFGFNIANGGDLDGDGKADLLVSAPEATPRFDADPNDANDTLNTPGVDNDFNGARDAVPGDDELKNAGLVYVIYGKNRLDQARVCQDSTNACSTAADCPTGKACVTATSISVSQLGRAQLQGFIVAGRRAGDRLGGGDAGETAQGGIAGKQGRGRSKGLAPAGDIDGDGRADIVIGSVLADPDRDPNTEVGVQNGGEVYLIYGSAAP